MNNHKKRYVNRELLSAVRHLRCVCCDSSYSEAAHADMYVFGKGLGMKASDAAIMALCNLCHIEHGNGNKISKDEKSRSTYFYIVATYHALLAARMISSLPNNIDYDDSYYEKRAQQIINAVENHKVNILKF